MLAREERGEVAEQLLGTAIQLLVEGVDDLLGVNAAPAPLAIRAAQVDAPAPLIGGSPVDGIDEARLAGRADVKCRGIRAEAAWQSAAG